MTQRKVVAAWSSTVPHRVLDDGSEWIFDGPDGKWSRFTPPLPPEALDSATDEPHAPDLGEWPGKPDVPPDTSRDIEILTSHGAFRAYHSSRYGWCAYSADRNHCAPVDPRDVLRWREHSRAVVVGGRVTEVTRG